MQLYAHVTTLLYFFLHLVRINNIYIYIYYLTVLITGTHPKVTFSNSSSQGRQFLSAFYQLIDYCILLINFICNYAIVLFMHCYHICNKVISLSKRVGGLMPPNRQGSNGRNSSYGLAGIQDNSSEDLRNTP